MKTSLRILCLSLFVEACLCLPDACGADTFTDYTATAGYDAHWNHKVAWGDYNNDGYVDFLNDVGWKNNSGTNFVRLSGTGWNYPNGAGIWGDYNNDGYLDIFNYTLLAYRILGVNEPSLFQNNSGTGSMTDVTVASLPAVPVVSSRGACWADLNGDAYLDLYYTGFEDWNLGLSYPDAVLMNDGDGTFTLSWTQANVYRARGVTACDFDEDGDMDIYVSNYRLQPNLLWLNAGTDDFGDFTDVAAAYGAQAGSGHSIGAAWGDLDNDGHIDLFAGNFAHAGQPESQFLRNEGAPNYHFEDKSAGAGLAYQESYASPALGDYDNDGDLDLYFANAPGYGGHCVLYTNNGNWTFADVTDDEGLSGVVDTYQAAWADFDNDGDLDLLTASKLFRSNASENGNHWLKVHLKGDGVTVNRAAIGAQVRIDLGGGTILTRQVEGGTGEGNQNDLKLHFGLGSEEGPVDLEITWPDGTGIPETKLGVAVDGLTRITFGNINNTPPTANAQDVSVGVDTAESITLTGSDVDGGDTLTYVIMSDPSNGTLDTLNAATGTVTYTPGDAYEGSDTFTFKVNDGTEDSYFATVTLTVSVGGGSGPSISLPPYNPSLSNIHWLSLMSDDTGYTTAADLAADLDALDGTDGSPVSQVSRWDGVAQQYEDLFWLGSAWVGADFAITAGEGYLVMINGDVSSFSLTGSDDPNLSLSMTHSSAKSNIHWVALPNGTTYSNASNMANDIDTMGGGADGSPCSQVSRWNGATQQYEDLFWLLTKWEGMDFSISEGEAYLIMINGDVTSWEPQ